MLNNQGMRCWHLQMPTTWKRHIIAIILAVGIPLLPAALHGQATPPLTLDQVQSLLKIGAPDATIANEVQSRGISFQPSLALLIELQREGAGDQTLAVLRKLIPAGRTICESFDGCMAEGQHAFHDKQWNQARAYFEYAATISPNSGQTWNSLGKVYLALQQTQEAYSAWDRALNSEDGVALTACMENGQPICDGGTLRLTSTTLFRYKGEEKVFEVPLSAVTVIGTVRHGWPSYLTFEMLVNGTNYGFDFFPLTVNCSWTNILVCPAEGKIEQAAIGSYFEQAFRRLVPGRSDGDAVFPPVGTSPQRVSSPLRIQVWHRHRPAGAGFLVPDQITYCQGFLTVYQGNVEYDCTVPDRILGRCEHSMISPVHSVEYKGGGLRVVGRGGNWDFFGNANDLTRAHDAIAATLHPQK